MGKQGEGGGIRKQWETHLILGVSPPPDAVFGALASVAEEQAAAALARVLAALREGILSRGARGEAEQGRRGPPGTGDESVSRGTRGAGSFSFPGDGGLVAGGEAEARADWRRRRQRRWHSRAVLTMLEEARWRLAEVGRRKAWNTCFFFLPRSSVGRTGSPVKGKMKLHSSRDMG